MNISIDYQARIPIYEQIVNKVEYLVAREVLKSGDQIPSIRDLACLLGVNPNTVKKAYDILEGKGIIMSRSTKGTFITDNVREAQEQKIENLFGEIKEKIGELKTYGLTNEEIIERIR
ncbi:MAG: GntR family transcriptional regulator [Bacilli bacterium]|nr:GntR family transcriptional regulator [Bacilli bacterium]